MGLKVVRTKVILDKRSKKKDGTYPLKLHINYNGKRKYFGFGIDFKGKNIISLKENSFLLANKINPRDEYKELKIKLNEIELKAHRIIKDLDVFTFRAFEKAFYNPDNYDNVFSFFDKMIRKKKINNKLRTADSYTSTKNFVKRFVKNDELVFEEITTSFLEDLTQFSNVEGISKNGFAVYMRTLRATYNQYYKETEKIPKRNAFFNYKIETEEVRKRALAVCLQMKAN